jgi:hypothetical protein
VGQPAARGEPGLTALRRGAITACRWLVLAFLLAGRIQIFLVGLGVFSFRDHVAAAGTPPRPNSAAGSGSPATNSALA